MKTMMHLMRYLWAHGVKFKVVGHAPEFLAPVLEGTLHSSRSREVARTLVVMADHQYWMVVVPAGCGIDWHRLCDVLPADCITRVAEEELKTIIPGGTADTLSPFGHLYGFPIVIDRRLTEEDEIAFNACSPTDVIIMKYRDFERLACPLVAEIARLPSLAEV